MPSDLGGSADEPVSMLPPAVLGGASDESVSFIPSTVLGGGADEPVIYIPSDVLGGAADEIVSYGPGTHYGGTTGTNVAPLAPPRCYGGPTGHYFPETAPLRGFGGPTSEEAEFPPPYHFGGPTVGTASSLIPARSFGGCTWGITEGLPVPINLTATVIDAGCIQLDWVDPGPEEDGYKIQRSLFGMGDWEIIGTVGADVVTFLDRFAVPLVVYDYRVYSFDEFTVSVPSNIATAVTPLPPDLPVSPPPSAPVDPIRNRIEPDTVEFKSPGVYGLEKDDDGSVTGFKY